MGILNSKISPSAALLPEVEQGEGPFSDPRSPTLNINRSPISQEGVTTRAAITKTKNLTAALAETDAPVYLHTPNNVLPKRFQSIVDPRSPSTFTRTPLVVDPNSPAGASNDCSLLTVVSSLEYADISVIHEEENLDASFKDCESALPTLCNLQLEDDDSVPMIRTVDGKDEDSVFEDAEITPFAGNDPRSPSIAIVRTPMVLVQDEVEESPAQNAQQVANALELIAHTAEMVESQQRTPQQQGILDSGGRGEQTPKKEKHTPSTLKAGSRTPLGCVTNTGALSHIRKMALIGQMKQTLGNDEQKLLPRPNANTGSAELNATSKNSSSRSRIPKYRLP